MPNLASELTRRARCRSRLAPTGLRLVACLCFPVVSIGCAREQVVRVAAFNIWELRAAKLNVVDAFGRGTNSQLRNAAEIIQIVRPDILFVMEIDYDDSSRQNAASFNRRYLNVAQRGKQPIDYPYQFFGPVNCGIPTAKDLDNDGKSDGPADAFGYGNYPGEYGLALFSRFPIQTSRVRTFQHLLWKDMPGNLMPDGSNGKPAWYSPDEVAILRLSHKNHWDIPVTIDGRTLHVLCTHPTPQIYDGPEDWNGRRNFDEIRFWSDYIAGSTSPTAAYIDDDAGRHGGLNDGEPFVLVGDLNAEPFKHPAPYGVAAPDQLLRNPRIRDPRPTSAGAAMGEITGTPPFPERRTMDFGRIDYALACEQLQVAGAGVFWPDSSSQYFRLVAGPDASSDHRLVWIDIVIMSH